MAKFRFKYYIIGQNLPKGNYAQTALADLDNDGGWNLSWGSSLESSNCSTV